LKRIQGKMPSIIILSQKHVPDVRFLVSDNTRFKVACSSMQRPVTEPLSE
jgi:hypothetical protein